MYTVKLATKILLVTCKIQTIKRTKQQNLPLPEVRVKHIIATAQRRSQGFCSGCTMADNTPPNITRICRVQVWEMGPPCYLGCLFAPVFPGPQGVDSAFLAGCKIKIRLKTPPKPTILTRQNINFLGRGHGPPTPSVSRPIPLLLSDILHPAHLVGKISDLQNEK